MKLSKEQIKDIGIRTLKTAVVAFFTAFVGAITLVVTTDLNELKIALYHALIVAGTATGTAILNILVKLVSNFIDDFNLTEDEIKLLDEAMMLFYLRDQAIPILIW